MNISLALPSLPSKIQILHSWCNSSLLPLTQKIKFFIYIVILLKFRTEQFYMYTNNNSD